MVLAFMQIQSRSNIFWSTIVLIGIWLYFIISLNINNKSRKQEEME